MIPKSIIDEVVRKTEIAKLISESMPLQQYGTQLVGTCPFCHQSRFMVSQSKNIFKCFTCQKGGGPIPFVQLTQRKSFTDTVRFLAARLGIEVPEE